MLQLPASAELRKLVAAGGGGGAGRGAVVLHA